MKLLGAMEKALLKPPKNKPSRQFGNLASGGEIKGSKPLSDKPVMATPASVLGAIKQRTK